LAWRSRRMQRRDANTKLTCMFFGAYSFNSTAETICSCVEVVEHLIDHGGLKGHLTSSR
jgi:hypothetical protein